jgi:hypothetical protein
MTKGAPGFWNAALGHSMNREKFSRHAASSGLGCSESHRTLPGIAPNKVSATSTASDLRIGAPLMVPPAKKKHFGGQTVAPCDFKDGANAANSRVSAGAPLPSAQEGTGGVSMRTDVRHTGTLQRPRTKMRSHAKCSNLSSFMCKMLQFS